MIHHIKARIEAQSPRVAALDRLDGAEGFRGITETAKLLKMSRSVLTPWLVASRWIYRWANPEMRSPFWDEEVALLLESVPYHFTGVDGTPKVRMRLLVTPKGLATLGTALSNIS